jgi:hypothetical protein
MRRLLVTILDEQTTCWEVIQLGNLRRHMLVAKVAVKMTRIFEVVGNPNKPKCLMYTKTPNCLSQMQKSLRSYVVGVLATDIS